MRTYLNKTIVLLLSAMSIFTSLFAYAGTESGGGGDAIFINGQWQMRDLVIDKKSYHKLSDNNELYSKYPEIKETIMKIGKVKPYFAASLLQEILSFNIYITDLELEILPAGYTAISNIKAERQVAIRYFNDVIISMPAFNALAKNTRGYQIIHEALHAFRYNNEGPIHHAQIREAIKYLATNINNLNERDLTELLYSLGFTSTSLVNRGSNTGGYFSIYANAMFNEETEVSYRCEHIRSLNLEYKETILNNEIYIESPISTFLGIKCKYKAPLKENFPALSAQSGLNSWYDMYDDLTDLIGRWNEKDVREAKDIKIKKNMFGKLSSETKNLCNINKATLNTFEITYNKNKNYFEFYKYLNTVLHLNENNSTKVRDIYIKRISAVSLSLFGDVNDYSLIYLLKEIVPNLNRLDEILKTLKENDLKCSQ